jgi:hypothetical protein
VKCLAEDPRSGRLELVEHPGEGRAETGGEWNDENSMRRAEWMVSGIERYDKYYQGMWRLV